MVGVLLTACGELFTPSQTVGSLVVATRVEPAVVHSGERIEVTTTIRNLGPDSVSVVFPSCWLQYTVTRGKTAVEPWSGFVRYCVASSMRVVLQPGDSAWGHGATRVESGPGDYWVHSTALPSGLPVVSAKVKVR